MENLSNLYIEAYIPSGKIKVIKLNWSIKVEKTYIEEAEYAARIAWIQANFITDDSIWLGAKSIEKMGALSVKFANEAKKFDGMTLSDDMRRRLNIIKGSLTLAAPDDAAKNPELDKKRRPVNI